VTSRAAVIRPVVSLLEGRVMDLDTCNALPDASPATLSAVADLIAASRSEEQMVYREIELDEVWRLLLAEQALGGDAVALDHRIAAVHEIHDMIAVPADPSVAAAAAARLRALAG
jgi:hypothetical protein